MRATLSHDVLQLGAVKASQSDLPWLAVPRLQALPAFRNGGRLGVSFSKRATTSVGASMPNHLGTDNICRGPQG